MKTYLTAATLALTLLLSLGVDARATLQSNQLNNTVSDALACNGHPWVDVKCYGAVGNDTNDDTAAFNSWWADLVTNNVVGHIPPGIYKVTSGLVFDLQGLTASGTRVVSENATIDGTSISAGTVLTIQRSGGTTGSPATTFGFTIDGTLTVKANSSLYACVVGKTDFSDWLQSSIFENLACNNAGSSVTSGGLKINYVSHSQLHINGTTTGGAAGVAGVALEQVKNSQVSGSGAASGASAPSLLIENGTSTGDLISAFSYGTSATGLSITSSGATANTFLSPNFTTNATPINATVAGAGNVVVQPTGLAGPVSGGIAVIGRGALNTYSAPSVSSFTAVGASDGLILSSANYSGTLFPVTLPTPSQVGVGWTMGFVTAANKGFTLTPPGGVSILAGNLALTSMKVAGSSYEFVKLTSDGTNFRVDFASQATQLQNGIAGSWPTVWNYPGGAGYAATQGDNGSNISSGLTSGGLTITLPSTTAIQTGWTIGVAADTKLLVVDVNATSGGSILFQNGTPASTWTVPQGTLGVLQFDGANFRLLNAVGYLTYLTIASNDPTQPLLTNYEYNSYTYAMVMGATLSPNLVGASGTSVPELAVINQAGIVEVSVYNDGSPGKFKGLKTRCTAVSQFNAGTYCSADNGDEAVSLEGYIDNGTDYGTRLGQIVNVAAGTVDTTTAHNTAGAWQMLVNDAVHGCNPCAVLGYYGYNLTVLYGNGAGLAFNLDRVDSTAPSVGESLSSLNFVGGDSAGAGKDVIYASVNASSDNVGGTGLDSGHGSLWARGSDTLTQVLQWYPTAIELTSGTTIYWGSSTTNYFTATSTAFDFAFGGINAFTVQSNIITAIAQNANTTLSLERLDSSGPASGETVGQVGFDGQNASDVTKRFASIIGQSVTTTAGSEVGTLAFNIINAGSTATVFDIESGGLDIRSGYALMISASAGTSGNFLVTKGANTSPSWTNIINNLIFTSATPTVTSGQVGFGDTTVAAGSGTCPSGTVGGQTVAGCNSINIGGTARNVPYF